MTTTNCMIDFDVLMCIVECVQFSWQLEPRPDEVNTHRHIICKDYLHEFPGAHGCPEWSRGVRAGAVSS